MEVPTCDTGFLHEKWPPFWGSSKLTFFENVSCNRPSWYKTYQLSGSHSVKALSPKKSICAQKAINFSIPTKIVVAARQSVKSQLHVSKQPIKNQAVKIGLPKTWPYQTPKRDVRPRHGKKDSKESSPPVWVLWMLETATKFANHSKKKLERIFGKENVWTGQQLEDFTTLGSQKMVSSATKRKIKAKGDKMLTLERYFESCGRDLSRSLS